jgi:hypothetical protein
METSRSIIRLSTKLYVGKLLIPWTIFVTFSVIIRVIEGRSDYDRMFYISVISYPATYISFIIIITIILILTMIFKRKILNEVVMEMNRNI